MEYKPVLKTLSVAAPAYNESEGISAIVEQWHQYLQNQDLEAFEIVICNDGSKDDTGKILKELSSKHSEIKVVEHAKNKGAAAALTTAIQNTSYDWVLLLDSDGQFPIENMDNFRKSMAVHNAHSFIGVRPGKQNTLFTRFGSWASGLVSNFFLRTRYKDFNSACQLVDGKVLRWLRLEARGLNYSPDITSKLIEAGFAPIEVDIRHKERLEGKSSHKLLRDALHRFLFIAYIGFRQLLFLVKVLQRPSDFGDRPYG